MITELCKNFKIQHHNSSPYRAKINGAVEPANKNIKKIVQKMTDIQILARDVAIFSSWVPYLNTDVDKGNTLFFGKIGRASCRERV